jgi:hypothetical protein
MNPSELLAYLSSVVANEVRISLMIWGAPGVGARLFGVGGQILRDLGLSQLRLMTNHPKPMPGLHGFGLDIIEHVPILV